MWVEDRSKWRGGVKVLYQTLNLSEISRLIKYSKKREGYLKIYHSKLYWNI